MALVVSITKLEHNEEMEEGIREAWHYNQAQENS